MVRPGRFVARFPKNSPGHPAIAGCRNGRRRLLSPPGAGRGRTVSEVHFYPPVYGSGDVRFVTSSQVLPGLSPTRRPAGPGLRSQLPQAQFIMKTNQQKSAVRLGGSVLVAGLLPLLLYWLLLGHVPAWTTLLNGQVAVFRETSRFEQW